MRSQSTCGLLGLVAILVATLFLPAVTSEAEALPSSSAARRVTRGRLRVDGLVRAYRVYAPRSVEKKGSVPLVIVLHHAGGDPESITQVTQFDFQAKKGGFVVVYPKGVDRSWNGGFCCGSTATRGIDDVAFIRLLIDRMQDDYPIDEDRVYAVGLSAGAVMAHRLACELAGRITGIGSVAGTLTLDECNPVRPVSVLQIHGTADPIVPYEGGFLTQGAVVRKPVPSAPALVERWSALNGCSLEQGNSKGRVTTIVYRGCRRRRSVSLVALRGAGHNWYASEFGPVEGAIDATRTIASFFGLSRGDEPSQGPDCRARSQCKTGACPRAGSGSRSRFPLPPRSVSPLPARKIVQRHTQMSRQLAALRSMCLTAH